MRKNKWEEKENISQKRIENKQIEKSPEDIIKKIKKELIIELKNNITIERLREILPNNIAGIYLIRNLINNKIYIGSSANLKERMYQHFTKLLKNKHKNVHLQNAWNKYKQDNLVFEIIKFITLVDDKIEIRKRLMIEEQYYLDTLLFANNNDKRFIKYGYNIIRKSESNYGLKINQESINKRSNELKDRYKNGELIGYWQNKKLPDYVIEKVKKNHWSKTGTYKPGKIVVNIVTGEEYYSTRNAWENSNLDMPFNTFRARISGSLKNTTNYKYKDGKRYNK